MGRPEWVVYVSQVAATSASGHEDELRGRSEPDEPDYQVRVRRLWPFGLRSRPPAGADAVSVQPNAAPSAGVMVGAESPLHGPSDLAEGEVAIYNAATGTLIRLWADGKVTINSPSGKDVVVNDGVIGVGRVIAGALMATWMGQVESAINTLAPGSVTPLSTTFATSTGIVAPTTRFKG